eukprot:TRINITY_DN33635_c0_g1_i1.p1 TRINITY_DN33635_c0_g1~~TRINITY_DN33635_c0_g1_i1.p1  ORF type:complete len:187 (-),score=31.71 TRINITY_DN33635_c0_g1_i1:174-734(-)
MQARGLKSVETMTSSAGSKYEGDVKEASMDGQGKFTMANGNFYIGQLKDGQFHGNGVLYFPTIGRYHGRWDRGKMIKGKYVFEDGLVYDEHSWQYCPARDRRFYVGGDEDEEEPAPQSEVIDDEVSSRPIEIPAGCYDVGDGYYYPKNNCVCVYTGEFVRHPTKDEVDWITKSCAQNNAPRVNFGH